MNRKTLALALVFFTVTLVWLGYNLYWRFSRPAYVCGMDLMIAGLFVLAAGGMTLHELRKKKRVHLDEANKHQIP